MKSYSNTREKRGFPLTSLIVFAGIILIGSGVFYDYGVGPALYVSGVLLFSVGLLRALGGRS